MLFAIPIWLAGYAVTVLSAWKYMPHKLGFPASISYKEGFLIENAWNFCTTGVMLQATAYFLLIRKIKSSGRIFQHIVQPVSKLSYGIYLVHMFILPHTAAFVRSSGMPTPAVILCSAIITYASCSILIKLLSFLPKSQLLTGYQPQKK